MDDHRLDADVDARRIKTILKTWLKNGVLRKVDRKGTDRHSHVFIEPGKLKES